MSRRWFQVDDPVSRWSIAAVAAIVLVCGLLWQNAALLGGGAVVLCLVLRRVASPIDERPTSSARPRRPARGSDGGGENRLSSNGEQQDATAHFIVRSDAEAPNSTGALVDDLLATGRYALLLRPQAKQHLTQLDVVRAVRQLDEAMALVPAGRVLLGQLAEQSNSACGAADVDPKLISRQLVDVAPVYLDRYAVTNGQFQQFVDGGGYEQLELWHEEALPALLDFVDQTGAPGPRYWNDGQFPAGEQQLPAVGVSWYEACAYARWVGKQLPTDAQWTKAGAWPVESAPGRIAQRRYPWGESFDVRRANLYGAGNRKPTAVDEFPGGMSVGGIHQLIGNVWEWTATSLVELGDSTLHVSESVMSIRGGAFDTYFENQATCHYQSGEHPLSRRPNVGFRLALPMSDLEVVNEDAASSGGVDEPVERAPATEGALATC
jgi:gamma-glutamyl hercynylcysteine S-oxide synthase